MSATVATSWGHRRGPKAVALFLTALLACSFVFFSDGTTPLDDPLVSVVVVAERGALEDSAEAVTQAGGELERPLPIINGYAARAPRSAVAALQRRPEIVSVTPDGRMQPLDTTWSANEDASSLHNIAKIVGVTTAWDQRYTGKGIDVALIDTGVSPVPGLAQPGKIVHGPDLSFDSQADNLRYLDAYGHGTHMAGIIGGNDTPSSEYRELTHPRYFAGIAPDARIVNVKVGASDGATDVSQVIAAIDWVVQNRNRDGLNIRVLNLSFGTDSVQDYTLDPLSYAAEVAWRKGIVVVVAAGNDGTTVPTLSNPAMNPNIIAVGSDDPRGTVDRSDDVVPPFATRSTTKRNVDVIAPGRSVVSLRVPNSYADVNFSSARVSDRFFRGTGTSQSAAVVSGLAAVVLQKFPQASPEQVKDLLRGTGYSLPNASGKAEQGKGLVDAAKIFRVKSLPSHKEQGFAPSTGTGSVDAARGTHRLYDEGVELSGELDIFGQVWDGRSWSADAWNEVSWSAGSWRGLGMAGDGWIDHPYLGRSWSGRSWSGRSWSGRSWSGRSWSDNAWTGRSWSEGDWAGRSWSATEWTGRSWSHNGWTGYNWSP